MHLKYNNVNENYTQDVCLSVPVNEESCVPIWRRCYFDIPNSSRRCACFCKKKMLLFLTKIHAGTSCKVSILKY